MDNLSGERTFDKVEWTRKNIKEEKKKEEINRWSMQCYYFANEIAILKQLRPINLPIHVRCKYMDTKDGGIVK